MNNNLVCVGEKMISTNWPLYHLNIHYFAKTSEPLHWLSLIYIQSSQRISQFPQTTFNSPERLTNVLHCNYTHMRLYIQAERASWGRAGEISLDAVYTSSRSQTWAGLRALEIKTLNGAGLQFPWLLSNSLSKKHTLKLFCPSERPLQADVPTMSLIVFS